MARFSAQFSKETLRLAWPISLQSILVTLLGMIDIIMVSHLGDEAMASVGISNRIVFVFLVMLTGIASGVGVLSAQYFGAGQRSKIKNIIVMASVFSVIFLIPVFMLTVFFSSHVLKLASSDASVLLLGQQYLLITIPSLFFVAIILIFEHALRAIGQVKLPMLFSVLAIVLNIFLNYWLIHGGMGVDAMGVEGAAWATSLSRLFHVFIIIYILYKVTHPVFPSLRHMKNLREGRQWRKFLQLIWPMMLSFGVWSLGTFIYQLVYGQMGTQELAVMSMLMPIEGILIAFFIGFSSACAIIVGQSLGKNDFQEAWHTGVFFVLGGPVITFILAWLIYYFEWLVFKPFNSIEEVTLALASEIFVLLIFGTCLKVYNMTVSMGVLRAGGDNKFCLYIDTVGMWIVSIPLTFMAALYFQWPLFWVVVTAYSEEICKIVMFSFRMRQKIWLKNLTVQ